MRYETRVKIDCTFGEEWMDIDVEFYEILELGEISMDSKMHCRSRGGKAQRSKLGCSVVETDCPRVSSMV